MEPISKACSKKKFAKNCSNSSDTSRSNNTALNITDKKAENHISLVPILPKGSVAQLGLTKATFKPKTLKNIIQSDEDVGKVSSQALAVLSDVLESFIAELSHGAINEQQKDKQMSSSPSSDTKILPQNLKSYILKNSTELGFLKEIAGKVQDISENGNNKVKKKRCIVKQQGERKKQKLQE